MAGVQFLARRRLLFLIGAAATMGLRGAAGSESSPSSDLSFSVWRNDCEIGAHRVFFEQSGDKTLVRTEADFAVRFGPIVLYRYRYRVTETWADGLLHAVSAKTNDNGTAEFVEAHREGDRLSVTGSKSGTYLAPAGAIAATHWNQTELDQPMINPQNGELMRFERRDLGEEQLSNGDIARHVALSGFAQLDLWYDHTGSWRALRAVASDGSIIDYRPR